MPPESRNFENIRKSKKIKGVKTPVLAIFDISGIIYSQDDENYFISSSIDTEDYKKHKARAMGTHFTLLNILDTQISLMN